MITESLILQKKNRDIKIIVDGIISNMSSKPFAIYLCGGQGRDEGSWIEGDNGEILPYNDYDVAVIADTGIEYQKLQILRKQLAKTIGIRWVDIDFYTINQIKKFTPTIHNIDLMDASTLIFGENVLKEFSRLDYGKIGKTDLDKLYKTRIWTLLGSWDGEFHNLKGEKSRFFKNQMAKCVLAACDMILIAHHDYTTSYCKRVEKAVSYNEDSNFVKWAKWAISEKLRPSSNELSIKEMKEMYSDIKKIFLSSFADAMGKKSSYYLNPSKTKYLYLLNPYHYLLKVYLRLKTNSSRYEKGIDVFIAQNYVLHAYSDIGFNQSYLHKATVLLEKWGYGHYEKWKDLHNVVANARNNI